MKLLIILPLLLSLEAIAKFEIITTTTNLADVTKQIVGEKASVNSLSRGVQDPHFLEAKPSYTFKLSRADLLVSVGASLEVGWLPLIIRGSRNPELNFGGSRHIVAAESVDLLNSNPVELSRSQGDIHPEGNPHFMLSPLESVRVAKKIAINMGELDKKNKSYYLTNYETYKSKIDKRMKQWKDELKPGIEVVSYHRTLSYFYRDFKIDNIDVLEPKPGVPPSASHIIGLIKKIKNSKVKKILVENYFDETIAKRIKKDIPYIQIYSVPVAVAGSEDIKSIFDLYDHLVNVLGKK